MQIKTGTLYEFADFLLEPAEQQLTKNGQVGTLAQSESIGLGIRVLAKGGWGFASTDRLTRDGVSARTPTTR